MPVVRTPAGTSLDPRSVPGSVRPAAACWTGRCGGDNRSACWGQASPPTGRFTAVTTADWFSCRLAHERHHRLRKVGRTHRDVHGRRRQLVAEHRPSGYHHPATVTTRYTSVDAGSAHACGLAPTRPLPVGATTGPGEPADGTVHRRDHRDWFSCGHERHHHLLGRTLSAGVQCNGCALGTSGTVTLQRGRPVRRTQRTVQCGRCRLAPLVWLEPQRHGDLLG